MTTLACERSPTTTTDARAAGSGAADAPEARCHDDASDARITTRPPPRPQRADGAAGGEEDHAAGTHDASHSRDGPARSSPPNDDGDGSSEARRTSSSPRGGRGAADPSSCDTPTLFVGGLHPRIADLHLQKLFSPYGEIVRINVVTHDPRDAKSNNGYSKSAHPPRFRAGPRQSRGYAFVEYRTVASARLAIARLDGRQLMGRSLAVRPSRRSKSDLSHGRAGSSGAASAEDGRGEARKTPEEARREYRDVQSRIEAVKRALEEKRRGA